MTGETIPVEPAGPEDVGATPEAANEPVPGPIEPATETVEPSVEPVEPATEPVGLPVEPVEPFEAVGPVTAVKAVEPAAPTPLPEPPATVDPALVPLEDIAPAIAEASLSRRVFLGFGIALAGGLAGAAALARLFPVFEDATGSASPIVPAADDPVGKQWTFVVDTSSCIGCGLCVVACKEENNVPEEPEFTRTWVERHTVTADEAVYIDAPDAGMNGFPPESTAPGAAGKAVKDAWFEPRLCMQCADSPCTGVCPVGATYRTEDGVILVDSSRCIGCGYCVVACPYGARYLVPAGGDAPNGTPGVADKCTWCYHRISRGAKPACVEVCPVGARQFGDAADSASDIAILVRERNPQPLHPEYGTRPRVLYLGPSVGEA